MNLLRQGAPFGTRPLLTGSAVVFLLMTLGATSSNVPLAPLQQRWREEMGEARVRPSAPAAGPALVFAQVTVIDVTDGTRRPEHTVVVRGNRIEAVGPTDRLEVPAGALVVDARGKYLTPGLWDMHTHATEAADKAHFLMFLINGVTGIRDAGSPIPLDTLLRWRREIVAGTRIGPPRQILSGQSIAESAPCDRSEWLQQGRLQACVADSADARHVVDSLQAAGVDMVKLRQVSKPMFFALAAEARRVGVPFGGHAIEDLSATEASDSGASIIDHVNATGLGWQGHCWGEASDVDECRPVAEQFRRNGTWWVLTLTRATAVGYDQVSQREDLIFERLRERARAFWDGSQPPTESAADRASVADAGAPGYLDAARRAGMPILAGTDIEGTVREFPPGLSLHAELQMYVAEGLTPLEALQTATLNPAKMLHGTDSLGTVGVGKLADLVLLDGDPLADIANTLTIRAVVANGRYFDRATLDMLAAEVRATAAEPTP